MSLLAAKLGRLTVAPGLVRPASVSLAGSGIDALISPRETEFGTLHLVERPLREWKEISAQSLGALALTEEALDTSRPFFFDTETTGLNGGTGTIPFLLGCASLSGSDGAGVVSQVHVSAPGRERPMLQWLTHQLQSATVLISFNGKSFDWPLLRARYVMNRLPPPPERPHVDLLHCARRVFRHHLEDVSLGSLERRVLDVHRQGDISGANIPAAWFDFLRTGRVAVLSKVLSHNERDVRSMVDLVHRLIAAWEERVPVLPATALGLAQVAVRAGDEARALRFVARIPQGEFEAALVLKAEVLRRRGKVEEAIEVLHQVLERSAHPEHHLRLAKLYEHRVRDLVAAERHALLCGGAEDELEHQTRIERLRRKLVGRVA